MMWEDEELLVTSNSQSSTAFTVLLENSRLFFIKFRMVVCKEESKICSFGKGEQEAFCGQCRLRSAVVRVAGVSFL